MSKKTRRCPWSESTPLYQQYHDTEWGVPIYESEDLWAKLILDGAQAGLSWITILNKRAGYYRLFAGLQPEKVARFTDKKIEKLLLDPAIVRNRLKVNGAVTNAKRFLEMQAAGEDFSEYLWSYVGGKPVQNHFRTMAEVPATTKTSELLSKDLKKRGFKFVGPTIIYAFMQAVGMVNDHLVSCPCHQQVLRIGR